jgi:hypothetical protein
MKEAGIIVLILLALAGVVTTIGPKRLDEMYTSYTICREDLSISSCAYYVLSGERFRHVPKPQGVRLVCNA